MGRGDLFLVFSSLESHESDGALSLEVWAIERQLTIAKDGILFFCTKIPDVEY